MRSMGLLCFLLMAGCAGLERAPSQPVVTQGEAVAGEPVVRPAAPTVAGEPVIQPPTSTVEAEPEIHSVAPSVVVAEPVVRPATSATTRSTEQSVAKIDSPDVKIPAKTSVAPVPMEQTRKKENAAPGPVKQEASLDIAALEKRLRETKAIGVFTKITLKNQVDDLLNQFRAFYQGRAKATLAELRQAYDRLLLKVLSLLQDKDQVLASAIVASRDAIWNILADPVKFSTL
jgi:hypothetical protein